MGSSKKDIIYQGNSIITIEKLPEYSCPVVVKKSLGSYVSPQNIRSLELEYEITQSLNGAKGVRQALELKSIYNQPALILEYIDGKTLRNFIDTNKLNLRAKIEIAISLARILGKIHQQKVIHLDLNCENILIGVKKRTIHIIDFSSASRIEGDGFKKVQADQILGTLPYIAPEQTGRINRVVDERSDLYSLGVVLYELMTGQLPFDSKDMLELVHHHLTLIPVSPSEVLSEIPEVISKIILKLLRKNAEDRYQSAAGVQVDLEICLQRLMPDNTIEEFLLGEADYTSRLKFPEKLYGRDSELKELVSAFNSACRETSSMVFVSGYSGIGKTALVEEMQRPVSEKRGYFIRGKFDQYLRTTPYTAMSQAFAESVSHILAETEKNFSEWRGKIQSAVGDLGKVLTEVIPILEKLIGTQPDVPELGGQEAENRFNYVFINFLLTVATEEHPLLLFIDDLQWIDAASLRLLKVIRSEFNQTGLLVIGAYRDNEVDVSHPLIGILDNQEQTGIPIRILKLDDLQPQHVETLLSDTLRSQDGIKELGTTVYKKTQGNPFFMRRLLSSLNEEGQIRYNSEIYGWEWNVGDIKTAEVSDNVADLLTKSIANLHEEAKNILKLAACIGNRFDIPTLATISGLGEQEVVKLLTVSLSGLYIFKLGSTYEFVHDQVHQAVYALIAEEDRPRVHLEIGRLLLSNAGTDEELEAALFDIVHHFNVGAVLLKSESEKVSVAELELKAARKARSTAAYAEGFAYVGQGLALLDSNSWQHHYDLTMASHNEAVELSYLTGQYDRLNVFEERIHKNAQSVLDRARVYYIRTMIDTDQGRLLESIETGIDALAELGIMIPRVPSSEDVQRAEAAFTEALATQSIEQLAHLSEMTDRGALAAMEIMAAVLLNAYIASPQHLTLLTHRGASLSLQKGNGPWSPFFYSVLVLLWAGEVDNSPTDESAEALETARKLAEILLRLLENPKYARCKAKSLDAILGAYNFSGSMKQLLDLSLEIYHSGLDTGDLVYAGLGVFHLANFGIASGMNLSEYIKTVSAYRKIAEDLGQDYTYRMTGIGLQTAQNLMTPSSEPDVLEEQYFDEHQWLPDAVAANDGLTLFLVFQAKLLLSYHFDCDGSLIEYSGEAEKYLESVHGMYNIGIFRFYDSLSRLRLYSSLSANEHELALKRVENNQLRMHIWALSGPGSYQHKYNLVAAEMARVSGNIAPAIEKYEQAIKGARDNGFIHEEALANELYACFWQERGNDKIAEMYMHEARALYLQWGAGAKVSHLEERYPQWFKVKTILAGKPDSSGGTDKIQTTITKSTTPIQLDLESITRASQLLSAETDLEQLLTKMITLVMANSGAEDVVLLLKQDNVWFVQARGDNTSEKYDILLNKPFDPADSETDLIPEPIFNYCQRSREVLVVGDVQLDHRFAEDRMIQKYNIQSMACIPALSKGEFKAMLYLENRQMADVFTLENVGIIKHLSAQFAVSVENALLYDRLKNKIGELQESELRFRSVVENANEAIVVTQDEAVKYCNPQIIELTGYTPEEMGSLGFDAFIHSEDLEVILSEYRARVSGEKPRSSHSIQIITKDGKEKFVIVNSALIDWDGRTATIAMLTDITELKIAEKELLRSEERFRQLMKQSPLAMEILSPDGRIKMVNRAWRKLWNVSKEEATETIDKYNMLTDPQIEGWGIMDEVKEAFKGKHIILPPIKYDTNQTRDDFDMDMLKEFKSPWIQCHLNAVKDAEGNIVFVVNTYVDISDLKKAEEEAKEQQDVLARIDRASSMGQLTGSIAHELNQPLTGILGNAQAAEIMLRNDAFESKELLEIMGDIVSDTKRAGDIIRNLRDLYKEQRSEFKTININSIVEETLLLFHSEFVKYDVKVKRIAAANMPEISGNKVQIQQVIVNLVMNAIEAMNSIDTKNYGLTITIECNGKEVKVYIDDQGPGIDDDKIDKIFIPLATWKSGGTGMGLAISNSIIESHGGRMHVENLSGGGARVGFELPIFNEN